MYLDILTPLFNMSVNSTEFGIGQGEGFHTASVETGQASTWIAQCAAGNGSARPLGSLGIAAWNRGCASQPRSQPFSAGNGSPSNQPGSTAANCRTNGKMAMSVAQGALPPSWSVLCKCASSGFSNTSI